MAKKKTTITKCKMCGNTDMAYRMSHDRYAIICCVCGRWQKWMSEKEIEDAKQKMQLI